MNLARVRSIAFRKDQHAPAIADQASGVSQRFHGSGFALGQREDIEKQRRQEETQTA